MKSPLGQVFYSRDGGMHAPLDRTAFDLIQAQAAQEGGGTMEVAGVGYRYGVVGWFGMFGAMRIEAGALIEAPGKHRRYRDALGLHAHDASQVLARVGNNTMDLTFGEKDLTFRMRLNPKDRMAQDIWARLMREDINASSIAFIPVEGDWEEDYDNSLDADPDTAGEKIEIFSITKAELIEVSLVTQGAFAGATSHPAGWDKPAGLVASEVVAGLDWAEPVADTETIDQAVTNSLPLAAFDANVEADEEEPEADQGAPDDIAEGDTGGEPGGAGEDNGGAAEPDDRGGGAAEQAGETDAFEEAEAQGVTLKDLLGRTPSDLKRRLTDVN